MPQFPYDGKALITFTKAGGLLNLSRWTIDRWAKRGLVLADGTRIFLQFVSVGRRDLTTHQWLTDFINARTAAKHADFALRRLPSRHETRAAVHREHCDAEAQLLRHGIKCA